MKANAHSSVPRLLRPRAAAGSLPLLLLVGVLGSAWRPVTVRAQYSVAVVSDPANQANFTQIISNTNQTNALLGKPGNVNSVIGLLDRYVTTYFGDPKQAVSTSKINALQTLVADTTPKVPSTASTSVANPSPIKVQSVGLSSMTGKVSLADVNFAYTGDLGSAGGSTPPAAGGEAEGLYPIIPEGESGVLKTEQKYQYAASSRVKNLFKPHTAVEKQVNFTAALFNDTDERIRSLRTELGNTLKILQGVSGQKLDFATIHAAQTKIDAMQTELQMQIGFRTAALQNLQMLDISNRNNESKRQLASQFQTTEAMKRSMMPGAADIQGVIQNPASILNANNLGMLLFLGTADF